MIKVADLIKQQNVLVVNVFSKHGALGPEKNYGLDVLLNQKNNDHKVNTNFLSASTIRIAQDNFNDVFLGAMGLILEDGEIYYAKESDAGYKPNITTIDDLERNRTLTKPNSTGDMVKIIGPRNFEHNELLILNPEYKGLFFWYNSPLKIKYDIKLYYKFCKSNKLFLYSIEIDSNGFFNFVHQIAPYERTFDDVITLINEKFE